MAHPTARKWVITPVIHGISRVNPLITGVITHLLSGMSHQVRISREAEELVIFGFLLGVFSSCAFVCSRFLFGLRLPRVGLLVC